MKDHECKLSKACCCSVVGLEPAEKCPVHEMTKAQRKAWEKRLRDREMRMLAYYQVPHAVYSGADGSFFMWAWELGYRAGRRAKKCE